ncbi:MAG TPA: ABC transporter permease [Vicinamibacterales bacterium]|nr:ABC transporter permease [Vicinamibacterales bacterium]
MRTLFSELRHRLRALFLRSRAERELSDELQFHLDREIERNRRRGLSIEEATRRAQREFGGLEPTKEACRDERGIGPLERLSQDLKYAGRVIRKSPGFTLAVVATLALGIGATTTMFGIVDGVLLRSLPYADASRLVQIGTTFGGSIQVGAVSSLDAHDIATRARSLTAVGASRSQTMDTTAEGATPERLDAAIVSASYFDVLGVKPVLGRTFTSADHEPRRDGVAVVSYGLWQRRFGGAPDVVGRTMALDGAPFSVVGVMPRSFRGPDALDQADLDVWVAHAGAEPQPASDRDDASWAIVARMTPTATVSAVREELEAIGKAIGEETGAPGPRRFWTATLQDRTIGDSARQLWMLLGAVSVLLLIACANVANLFLVRATERSREMAVRVAMGAGRGRIVRQLLSESALLSLLGGVCGIALAYVGVGLFRAFGPADLPRAADVAVDTRVLAFSLVISALAGLSFGLAPALDTARASLGAGLRATAANLTGSRSRLRLRSALVVAQTALAVVLLVGAGLLVNSVWRLGHVPPGFDPRDVVWIDVRLPARYADAPRRRAFYDDFLARVRALNGVVAAGGIEGRPLGGGNAVATTQPEGRLPAEAERTPRFPWHAVTPGYFAAMGIPIVDGRPIDESDRVASPRVAVISRAMAAQFWPGERAVGKRFWHGRVAADAPLTTVVGVAEDVRQYSLAEPAPPVVYRPVAQAPRATLGIVARHDGRSAPQVLQQIREAAWAIDPALPLDSAGTMDAQLRSSIAEPRFRAAALSAFGVMAAIVASVGLYATLAWIVRARRREIGIRIALGADPSAVRAIVLRRGLSLAVIGTLAGAAIAVAVSRTMSALVFGITATDFATFSTAVSVMLLVAALASWIPARRAAQANPVAILKD